MRHPAKNVDILAEFAGDPWLRLDFQALDTRWVKRNPVLRYQKATPLNLANERDAFAGRYKHVTGETDFEESTEYPQQMLLGLGVDAKIIQT